MSLWVVECSLPTGEAGYLSRVTESGQPIYCRRLEGAERYALRHQANAAARFVPAYLNATLVKLTEARAE